MPEYVGIEKEGLPYLLEPDVGESVVKETKNVKPSCVYLGDETEPEEIKGKNLRVVLRRVDTEEMKKDHLEQDAIQEVLRELELQEQDLGDVFAYFEEDKFFPLEALSDRVLQCQID